MGQKLGPTQRRHLCKPSYNYTNACLLPPQNYLHFFEEESLQAKNVAQCAKTAKNVSFCMCDIPS